MVGVADQGLEVARPANFLMLEERPDACPVPAVGKFVDLKVRR